MALVSADRRMRVRFRTLAASAVVLSVAVGGCTRVGDVEESKVSTDDPAQEISRPDRDVTTTTASESGPEVETSTTTPVIPETTVATVLGESTVAESTTTSQPGIVLSTVAPTTTTTAAAATTAGTLARPEQQSGSATQTTVASGAGTTATTSGVQVATTATSAVQAGDAGAETTTSAVSTTQTGATAGTEATAAPNTSAVADTSTTAGTSDTTSGDAGAGTATATTETAVETTTTAAPETTTTVAATTTTAAAAVLGTFEQLVEVAPNGAPIVARSSVDVASQLLLAETEIRAGRDLERNAHLQQVIYRRIARNPQWDSAILDAMPESYRASVSRNIEARRSFLSVASYPKVIPQWRVDEPIEGNTLLGYFQEAQDAHGIPWTYLAAMNLVESGMGRIVPYPTFPVGPRGPMQFRPETWERYGEGGDITNQRDSIMAAARMLADNDFNVDSAKALYAYNPKDAYVTGVTAYARTMTEEPNTFWGYYYWEVYYLANGGDLWLDDDYNHRYASQVDAYREKNPQAN